MLRSSIVPLWFVNVTFCKSKHPTTVKNTRQILTFLSKHLHNSNKSRTFASTESATLPVRSANQGGSFAFIPMVLENENTEETISSPVYDLNGMEKSGISKGWNIFNGKKILIKK